MSEDGQRFSSYLIGADSLLIECAELLLRAGHEVRGLITATHRLGLWARKRGIPVLDPKDYRDTLEQDSRGPSGFDYLFAITHLAILPHEVVRLPKKLAINFHDGPLPKYAGLNAPAWALINREERYGVTWHVIEADVDAGDILTQRLFDVGDSETSVSLNTRNFEAAIETFGELIDGLASGKATRTAQDLSKKSYFGRHDRPKAACELDFEAPAEDMAALVRALDFGRYANPLGLAKIHRASQVWAVRSAVATAESRTEEPGTILSVDAAGITVATGDGALFIQELSTLEGRPVAPDALGLKPGERFERLEASTAQALTDMGESLSRAEGFWVRRLANLDPLEVPYASTDRAGSPGYGQIEIPVPESLGDLTTLAAAFLGRLGHKRAFHVAFRGAKQGGAEQGGAEQGGAKQGGATQSGPAWLSHYIPLRVAIPKGDTYGALTESMARELERVGTRGTYLRDAIARYPELAQRPDLADGRLLPVAIVEDEHTPAPGSVLTVGITDAGLCLHYDQERLPSEGATAIEEHLKVFLADLTEHPDKPLSELRILSVEEERRVRSDWNDTKAEYDEGACVHGLFEQQVDRTPDKTAVAFESESLTYFQLNARANRLANHLLSMGVGPDVMVGICVERSMDLVVAALATQKAGGAYLPLDPDYPSDRIAFMISDSKAPVLITQAHLESDLPRHDAKVVRIDSDWSEIEKRSPSNPGAPVTPGNLAYVIYTSGSTGTPKGVMVEHRNVVNFFAGMDARIPHEPPGTWLAVTSLSFDISVLELFWTLTRGFKVVVYRDLSKAGQGTAFPVEIQNRAMDFGLFYWGNDDGQGPQKYRLLLEGARFADTHGFNSVWTPERHFHAFGGPYPNPAVTGAAVAAVTKNLSVRAGSCVIPLHHPVRVAEEWAVLDNLCNGRVGLAVASGWQPDDFLLRPENAPPNNKSGMLRDIEVIRKLWRGEAVEYDSPGGGKVQVVSQPRPVQKELPVWVTTAGNPQTWKDAGAIGANVLTHLLGQSIDEVAGKVKLYRDSLREHGYDPETFKVTLMLHTFVGQDREEVRRISRQPMKDYLEAAVGLVKQYAWAFPAFKRPEGAKNALDVDLTSLNEEELDGILEFAFERYFEDSGLFGTVDECVARANELKAIGIDEIACLIDYGVPTDKVLEMLEPLSEVVARQKRKVESPSQDQSISAQLSRHEVTHMQCTPSMARMLVVDDETRTALGSVQHLMVGGEAFPPSVAQALVDLGGPTITNMYGPTETTIWSSTHRVTGTAGGVPIGRPIANTELYILDENGQPVPVGVPGELYIGGHGVVRGYLERPELTAERFVADPFGDRKGARLYRTGDLVRYRDDGVVDFLGRTDHQVKIRGYRIELGEIEALLHEHEDVLECVVVAREDTPGDQRLVAYVVTGGAASLDGALRNHVKKDLPEYMVPSHFVAMEALPLTPNGKVDRNALPPPDAVSKMSEAEYVEPTGELDAQIAKLWQDTLGLERVGTEDNFFDIGGHSLLVVRIHRSLKEMLDQPVALTDLYRFPTIRSFVDSLSAGGKNEALKASASRAEKRRESMRRRRRRP